jgi:hypothetical protein
MLYQDINPGPASSSPMALTAAPPFLYFAAGDAEHGFEPWVVPAGVIFADGFESGGLGDWRRP